jgi:hypothetical protein
MVCAHASSTSVDCACSQPPAEDHHGPFTEACPTRDKIHMVWSAVRRLQGGRSPFPFQIRRRRLVPVCALSLFLAKV